MRSVRCPCVGTRVEFSWDHTSSIEESHLWLKEVKMTSFWATEKQVFWSKMSVVYTCVIERIGGQDK